MTANRCWSRCLDTKAAVWFLCRSQRWTEVLFPAGCTGMPEAESCRVFLWRKTKASIISLYPSPTALNPPPLRSSPLRCTLRITWTRTLLSWGAQMLMEHSRSCVAMRSRSRCWQWFWMLTWPRWAPDKGCSSWTTWKASLGWRFSTWKSYLWSTTGFSTCLRSWLGQEMQRRWTKHFLVLTCGLVRWVSISFNSWVFTCRQYVVHHILRCVDM